MRSSVFSHRGRVAVVWSAGTGRVRRGTAHGGARSALGCRVKSMRSEVNVRRRRVCARVGAVSLVGNRVVGHANPVHASAGAVALPRGEVTAERSAVCVRRGRVISVWRRGAARSTKVFDGGGKVCRVVDKVRGAGARGRAQPAAIGPLSLIRRRTRNDHIGHADKVSVDQVVCAFWGVVATYI